MQPTYIVGCHENADLENKGHRLQTLKNADPLENEDPQIRTSMILSKM